MWSSIKSVTFLILTLFSFLYTNAEPSKLSNCSPINPMNMTQCKKLVTLGAELGWNVHKKTQIEIDILFSIRLPADHHKVKWVAWGVNPGRKRPQMVGTRAIIGIIQPDGSLVVKQYNITSDTKLGCRLQPSTNFTDVVVHNMKGYVDPNRYMSIFATLVLPKDTGDYNISRLNHVWQVGFDADADIMEPKMHHAALQNVDSTETIDLNTGRGTGIGNSRHHGRTVHGILNIVGWGTLLPLGVIIARYFRRYPCHCSRWFVLHISCQIVGYLLGTAGWATGLWLGRASKHYTFHTHRVLAIFIFVFTTLQMLALRLRPAPTDEYRKYWDMYHHFLGYALLAVISVNIFRGIGILKPDKTWLWAYIGVIVLVGLVALGLEFFTWTKFLMAKSKTKPLTHQPNSSQSSLDTSPPPKGAPSDKT